VRIESSVTSVSWIPREAIEGMVKLPFELGVAHYDLPPPDLRGEPGIGDGQVRFTQTAGGQPGMPSPRRVRRRPYLQVRGPVVWSTLALTIRADATAGFEVVGASSFPRHWIYGHDGTLQAKTGLIDFGTWYRESFGEKNPWGGDEESPAVVTAVESGLERELSAVIIGSDPPFRRLRSGEVLVAQGDAGDELSSCSTGSWPSNRTAGRWPRSAPGPSWARWPCSRGDGARPPCGP
jgi:hypothetical protein